MKIKNKKNAFIKKSRSQKKKCFINIKNNIRQYCFKKKSKSLFYTYNVLTSYTQWADVFFLGHNRNVFYNATIETTQSAWHQKIQQEANERSIENSNALDFIEKDFLGKDKKLFEEYINKTEQIQKKLIQEKSVFISEGFQILFDFSFGIGLNIYIDVPYLTTENINHAIEKFLSMKEKTWFDEKKFQYDWKDEIAYSSNQIEFIDE